MPYPDNTPSDFLVDAPKTDAQRFADSVTAELCEIYDAVLDAITAHIKKRGTSLDAKSVFLLGEYVCDAIGEAHHGLCHDSRLDDDSGVGEIDWKEIKSRRFKIDGAFTEIKPIATKG